MVDWCSKKYHFLYKTTCIINNHYYIGRHSTDDLEDGYIGSGKRLKAAIKKYGRDNFVSEIISFFDKYEDVVAAETTYITEDHVKSCDCYNITAGGHGGYLSEEIYKNRIIVITEDGKRRISEANTGRPRPDVVIRLANDTTSGWNWLGKTRSEDDKKLKSVVALQNMENKTNPWAQQVVCPHCGKEGQYPNMVCWHFDNCKRKKE